MSCLLSRFNKTYLDQLADEQIVRSLVIHFLTDPLLIFWRFEAVVWEMPLSEPQERVFRYDGAIPSI